MHLRSTPIAVMWAKVTVQILVKPTGSLTLRCYFSARRQPDLLSDLHECAFGNNSILQTKATGFWKAIGQRRSGSQANRVVDHNLHFLSVPWEEAFSLEIVSPLP